MDILIWWASRIQAIVNKGKEEWIWYFLPSDEGGIQENEKKRRTFSILVHQLVPRHGSCVGSSASKREYTRVLERYSIKYHLKTLVLYSLWGHTLGQNSLPTIL